MFFSPITERSLKVRAFYLACYALLAVGTLTMVVPFIIMLGGSLEPGRHLSASGVLPVYLFDDHALWKRYVASKYRNKTELLKMAWDNADADFMRLPEVKQADPAGLPDVNLWQEWRAQASVPEHLFGLGFSDSVATIPYFNNREFRLWMAQRYETIEALNRELGSSFRSFSVVRPPNISFTGAPLNITPFVERFLEFSETVSERRKFIWDAGAYYRSVFLPATVGQSIAEFNAKYETNYASYAEIPFDATAPEVAPEAWATFVTKLLRPDLVEFTPTGKERFEASGGTRGDFIRMKAEPGDLRVVTLDRQFAAWARQKHGVSDARIPQLALDFKAFEAEKSFWKRTFFKQNYQYVLDEILLKGRAMRNTAILVTLMVAGTLLVNPLAAYALSRFKLRQSYAILLFFLATLSFPAEVTMIPVFLQLKELNLLNTFGALVLPGLANGFSIFLLKGFFDSLPKELYEAAEIDGASEWTMFWHIAMNLSKPILAVNVLAAFVSAYGAFFYALILAPDPKMWTIMVYIYQLQQSADTPVVYASLILVAIPTLLIFIFCQKIILRGIVVPSDK